MCVHALDFRSRRGDLRAEEADVLLQAVGGRRQGVWEGHLHTVLDVVLPALSLSPTSVASLNDDGFREGVTPPHDVAKPRQLPSPDGCQERF